MNTWCPSRAVCVALFACAIAVTLAVYVRTLQYGFAYDDYYFARPHTFSEVCRAFAGPWYTDAVVVPFYRPLTVAFHAARFHLLHFDSRGYHAVSLGLFAIVCTLIGVLCSRLFSDARIGLFAALAAGVHPGFPHALVSWATNQMHLLQTLVVLGGLNWWLICRNKAPRWWLPLLGFQVTAFLIKEDGVMLLPCVALLELAYSGIVERRWRLRPLSVFGASAVVLVALVTLRWWALGDLGGYRRPDASQFWPNLARGVHRTLLYQPIDRPWKLLAATMVLSATSAGLLASCLNWRQRRPPFLIVTGLIITVLFDLPFALVTKREQWYLLAVGSVLVLVGAVAALIHVRSRVVRASLAVVLPIGLVASASVSQQMSDDFSAYSPETLRTDRIVLEWIQVSPEVRAFLERKLQVWSESRTKISIERELRIVTYGLHEWEREPSGERFRWSTDFVRVLLGPGVSECAVPMRPFPRHSPTVEVEILVAGAPWKTLRLATRDWLTVRIPVGPASLGVGWRQVQMSVAPTWVPADVEPRSGDRRRLGVKIGELTALR